jgi:hypothetical protein
MKLRDIEGRFPPFDKPAGEAAYLLSTNKFVKYETPYNAPVPDLKWFAQAGDAIEDVSYPPSICYSCGTCGSKGRISGPNAAAQIVRHCMVAESCPGPVAVQYAAMRAAYLKKYPVKAKPLVAPTSLRPWEKFKDPRSASDIVRDNVVAASLGHKSPDVLQQEALAWADVAARSK